MLGLAACQKTQEPPVPTLMVLATFTPSPSQTPPPPTPALTLSFTPFSMPTLVPSLPTTLESTPAPTLAATSSPTPAFSPTASLSPVPTTVPVRVIINNDAGGYARSGPGTAYDPVGIVQANQVFDVLAYASNEGDPWFLIELAPGTPAWISSWICAFENDAQFSQVALAVTVPPSPTVTETFTPFPTITSTPEPTLPPGADAVITGPDPVNLRSGTGTNYNRLGTLPPGFPLRLVGRNADMSWYQVTTFDERQGWVKADLVTVYANPVTLPVSWIEPGTTTTAPDVSSEGSFSPGVMQQAQAIYQHGQQLGNNPHSLLLIGDSVTELGQFMQVFGNGNYDLGGYGYLQDTINFFGESGTFGATYQTIHSGYTFAMILDPTWADPAQCVAKESPLDCEYRLKKPSIAIIYLGLNDMRFVAPDVFQANADRVIQTLIGYGVIPVLTTFTIADTYEYAGPAPAYLQVLHDTAARYQIPLIDFYEAARSLPNRGTGPDAAHLTYRDDRRISFAGDQSLYGTTLRELLTLETLTALKQNVMGY